MREILFRGKSLYGGKWVEGFYCCLGGNYHYILTGVLEIANGYPDMVKHPVVPATVGQFTGLWDRNGKRIFEGDIVAIQSGTVFEMVGRVVFDEGAFQVVDPDDTYECLWYKQHEMEVLGNIHDKPGTSERR